MEEIFARRKARLMELRARRKGEDGEPKRLAARPVFDKCPSCGAVVPKTELSHSLYVCTKCGYHHTIGAYLRLAMLLDSKSFRELDQDLVAPNVLGFPGYEEKLERQLGSMCRSMGFDEIITYSFISPTCYDKIRWAADDARRESFKILNPLGEDTSIMRTTVLPSMLEILTRNYNYRNQDVRLYEVGRIYLPGGEDGLAVENKILSMGAYGEDMDFYTLKGCVEAILKDLRASDIRFVVPSETNPSYHPGPCGRCVCR